MIIGIPKETFPGERRVALIPAVLPPLIKAGHQILVETGAGLSAGQTDHAYSEKGAEIAATRADVFARAEIVAQVRCLGANRDAGRSDLALFRPGQCVIGFADPLIAREETRLFAERKLNLFAMELIPRTTRAQVMDALSSMATFAGYKAVLIGASHLGKMFPMMMTAAGTLSAAKVFIVGAGVAGLQAIASARKLGAVVQAYDVRPAVREQIESLGAKFVELPLETAEAEGKGGYAKEQDESFRCCQREMMSKVRAGSDLVITTAAIPGKKSPILVTRDMVAGMHPGSVIVDLAAERGGNCELTRADEVVEAGGVTILGPTNLPTTVPIHASQLYAKNVANVLLYVIKEGKVQNNAEDEIIRETLVTWDGAIVHPTLKDAPELAGAGRK